MDYGKYFTKKEFVCKHCRQENISQTLVTALNELRVLLERPIIISSGYRCVEHNRTLGSSDNSQHVKGTAADIIVRGVTILDIYKAAEKIEVFKNGGIGLYPDRGFVHLDVRGKKARWVEVNRKMVNFDEWIKDKF